MQSKNLNILGSKRNELCKDVHQITCRSALICRKKPRILRVQYRSKYMYS